MRRTAGGALIACAVVVAVFLAWRGPDEPALVAGDTVASDLAALADETFTEFLAASPAVTGCIGRPQLEAAVDLDDAARYDQAAGVIWLRVPATAASLEASLIHELAHHVEVACPGQADVRATFLTAQGHPPETLWFADVDWADRPSEQFAEAVVMAVLGERNRHQLELRVTPEAARVVAEWLAAG